MKFPKSSKRRRKTTFFHKRTPLFLLLALAAIFLSGTGMLLFSTVLNNTNTPFIKHAIPEGAQYVPNEIVVKYREAYNPEKLKEQMQDKASSNVFENLQERLPGGKSAEERYAQLSADLKVLGVVAQRKVFDSSDPSLENYYILQLKEGVDVKEVHEKLSTLEEFQTSEPNYIYTVQQTPNDPLYNASQWGLQKLQIDKISDITKGSGNVMVAVVDTGVDYNHEDLTKQLVKGRDFVQNDDDPMDDHGHGSHVAGIIAAISNNGIGISSLAPDIKIMAVKTMDSAGSGSMTQIVSGVKYAVDQGAQVINLSIAGNSPYPSTDPCNGTAYDDVFAYATQRGASVVIAAGNGDKNGSPLDASRVLPAACKNAIVVGAVDRYEARAVFSNYGSRVDVSAPGIDILSLKPATCSASSCRSARIVAQHYITRDGTSMAAPYVAGSIALLLSAHPTLTPDGVKACVLQNANKIQTDKPVGPFLNVLAALQNCKAPPPTKAPEAPAPQQSQQTSGRGTIFGTLYADSNDNKVRDSEEKGVANIQVELSGQHSRVALTNDTGSYSFDDLPGGEYKVVFKLNGQVIGFTPNTIRMPAQTEFNFPVSPTYLKNNGSSSYVAPTKVPSPTITQSANRSFSDILFNRQPAQTNVTPTPLVLYSCHEQTGSQVINGKQIQLTFLVCTPKR